MLGLLHYGLDTVTNIRRRSRVHDQSASFDAIVQSIIEGSKGHVFAMRTLDERWSSDRQSHDIPAVPLVQLPPACNSSEHYAEEWEVAALPPGSRRCQKCSTSSYLFSSFFLFSVKLFVSALHTAQ